jgi:hypothetical protein
MDHVNKVQEFALSVHCFNNVELYSDTRDLVQESVGLF